ncbi:DNA-binding transcriptional regulator, MerR family [Natronincola peptidivorans]|uniref:DNA-binding transcriptional regulator, MerR family n=1 Tax=Natronincola peptidivorans TaxID=426128 RepID=A0A1I0A350_9FIRM|nr:MerR family transcriptional regulator [Natronincola peptidivorans]SES88571.1 DNA-binding transcriptional regulator, MerR family [Natronincola peptidivorans]
MSYSISHLCKKFNLSRSTLLYYDSIGLLTPSSRDSNNYRRYSQEDVKRLEQICKYRQTGISLEEIKSLLEASQGTIKDTLEKRLDELNQEMKRIRNQQHLILGILKNEALLQRLQILEKDTLIEILRLAGLDEDDMDRLHAKLEDISPEGHQIFLEALGIDKEEIEGIREYARSILNEGKEKS